VHCCEEELLRFAFADAEDEDEDERA